MGKLTRCRTAPLPHPCGCDRASHEVPAQDLFNDDQHHLDRGLSLETMLGTFDPTCIGHAQPGELDRAPPPLRLRIAAVQQQSAGTCSVIHHRECIMRDVGRGTNGKVNEIAHVRRLPPMRRLCRGALLRNGGLAPFQTRSFPTESAA